jgi:ribosomal protein S18 acetylase RimI-like enzyme
MLDLMYNEDKLKSDLNAGVKFLVIEDNQVIKGFAAYQTLTGDDQNSTKLHKLYVLTDEHKRGYGGKLFDYVEMRAREACSSKLFLHVNRQNPSIAFYQRKGMEILKSEDNDIGNGYYMYDYVMEKKLN